MDDFPDDDFGNDDFIDEFDDPNLLMDGHVGVTVEEASYYPQSALPLPNGMPSNEGGAGYESLGTKRLRDEPFQEGDGRLAPREETVSSPYGDSCGVDEGAGSLSGGLDTLASLEAGEYPYPVSVGEAPPFISPTLLHFFLPNVPPTSKPVIVSVIAQANIPCGIDLRDVGCAVRTAEYLPENRIASATLRLQHPDAVAVVRSSGALTIIGAHSVSESRQAAELAARILRKALNLHFNTFHFRVRSITARFNACSPVRLDALALHVFKPETSAGGVSRVLCHYEPERFNGCTIRMVGQSSFMPRPSMDGENGRTTTGIGGELTTTTRSSSPTPSTPVLPHRNRWCVSCVVYVTGKMTFLGARSQEELDFAFHAVIPIIAQYIGPSTTTSARTAGSSDANSSGGVGNREQQDASMPPSKESVMEVIQRLREQWVRRRRELAGKGKGDAGEWMYENEGDGDEYDEDMEEDLMNGRIPFYSPSGERGTGDGESDEDFDNGEDDDMGVGGMDDF